MAFEANQESFSSETIEGSSLLGNISPQDLKAFNEMQSKSSGGGCISFLPECKVIDFEKDISSGKVDPIEGCFPRHFVMRTPEDGIFSHIREKIFGSNFNDLTNKVDKSALNEAVSGLSPEDRKKYEAEKKALDAYEYRQKTMMSFIDFHEPAPPTPTMEKVQQRAAQIEQAARQHVMAHLTPEERAQLEQEKKKYNEDNKDWGSPSDANFYRKVPEPGPMMKELERRTAAAVQSHAYKDQEIDAKTQKSRC